MVGGGWWITPVARPSPLPDGLPPPSLELLEAVSLRGGRGRRLRLRLSGPPQMNLILPGNLSAWSFATVVPAPRAGCDCHFIFLATGTPAATWNFEITLPAAGPPDDAPAVVELVFYGHYLEMRTPLLEEAEAALPPWVTPISWVSVLGSTRV